MLSKPGVLLSAVASVFSAVSTDFVAIAGLVTMACTVLAAAGGKITASMTWITPLLALMSALMTLALSTMIPAESMVILTLLPSTVFTDIPFFKSEDITSPGTTWYVRTEVSRVLLAIKASITALGTLAKASSVGANTVKGPGPLNVSTSPAAFTASTRVLKSPAATAVSTIFFEDSVALAFDA